MLLELISMFKKAAEYKVNYTETNFISTYQQKLVGKNLKSIIYNNIQKHEILRDR